MYPFLKKSLWLPAIAALLCVSHSPRLTAQESLQAVPFDEPASVIVTCSHCGKEVSGDAANGQRCPFCGTLWDAGGGIPVLPVLPPPSASDGEGDNGGGEDNPVAAPQLPPPVVGNPQQPPPRAPNAPQAPLPPAMNQGVPQEYDLASLPQWMKAAIFCATLGALYYIFFYRR